MEYRNIKTGAVITTTSVIAGKNWVQVTNQVDKDKVVNADVAKEKVPENDEAEESEQVTTEVEEEPETEVVEDNSDEFEGITKLEIKQELDAFGIKYNQNMTKSELYALMKKGK